MAQDLIAAPMEEIMEPTVLYGMVGATTGEEVFTDDVSLQAELAKVLLRSLQHGQGGQSF